VKHERAQLLVSARMDGQHVRGREAEAVDGHLATCARCRTFAERSARVRSAIRIRPAEPVPDLTDRIMEAVAHGSGRGGRATRSVDGPRHRRSRRATIAPAAAAAVAGLVLGSVVVGGPWQRAADRPIAAAAVVREVRRAAPAIESFRGRYAIVERGYSREVPERRFEMEVAFRMPQRFRLDVRDLTDYPSRTWTPNDLTWIQDVTATYASGPSGCPGDLPPNVCPRTRGTVTRTAAFSTAAPLPADLVVPLATFASPRGVAVVDPTTSNADATVRVELTFGRAAPMFPFLDVGGSWRPFYERDRVSLWLDRMTWRPVRWLVLPAEDDARRAWELRYGLPEEPPGRALLDVRLVEASSDDPDPSLFAIPDGTAPPLVALDDADDRLGYRPLAPDAPGDLDLVSVVLPDEAARSTPRSLLVYADGLDYLRIGERRDWAGPGPFGPLATGAQEIALPGGGVAYYEPAGDGFGRRLGIHAPEGDLYLETNLPRERLLEVAATIPIRGEPLPRAWLDRSTADLDVERVPVPVALSATGLAPSVVEGLPGGYVLASAELTSIDGRLVGASFVLRQTEMDMAGEPITLHVEPAGSLPTPTEASSRVRLDAGLARWSPQRSLLEWTGGDRYLSLEGRVPVETMIELANALTDRVAETAA
jgi:hypothetical protein